MIGILKKLSQLLLGELDLLVDLHGILALFLDDFHLLRVMRSLLSGKGHLDLGILLVKLVLADASHLIRRDLVVMVLRAARVDEVLAFTFLLLWWHFVDDLLVLALHKKRLLLLLVGKSCYVLSFLLRRGSSVPAFQRREVVVQEDALARLHLAASTNALS